MERWILPLLLFPALAWAVPAGITGRSGAQGVACAACHTAGAAQPAVAIQGPASLAVGATGNYALVITGGPGVRAGLNVALGSTAATLVAGTGTRIASNELTHTAPFPMTSGAVQIPFQIRAGATAGTVQVFAAGLSANGAMGNQGDGARTTTFTLTVTAGTVPPPVGNTPPVVSAVTATPAQVTGIETTVTATATDDGGAAGLRYTWSKTAGPGNVTFVPNASNAAQTTKATFSSAGKYTFSVAVADAAGGSTSRTVEVDVVPTVRTLTLSPSTVTLGVRARQLFVPLTTDQFGTTGPSAAAPTWTLSGAGGTISTAGVFTAGTAPVSNLRLDATLGGVTANAAITIAAGSGPTLTREANATVNNNVATLEVEATDDAGEARLIYEWTKLGGPGDVVFAPNRLNAAKRATATFSKAGQYVLGLNVTDESALSATTTLLVDVAVGSGPTNPGDGTPTAPGTFSAEWLGLGSDTRSFSGTMEAELAIRGVTDVTEVQFRLNDVLVDVATQNPWVGNINTCAFDDGRYVLEATVFAASGKSWEAPTENIRIANNGAGQCELTPSSSGGCASTSSSLPALLCSAVFALRALVRSKRGKSRPMRGE